MSIVIETRVDYVSGLLGMVTAEGVTTDGPLIRFEIEFTNGTIRVTIKEIGDVLIERQRGKIVVHVHGNDGDDDPLTTTTVIDQREHHTDYAINPVSVDSRRTEVKGDL